MHIDASYQASVCHKAYSEMGLLFVVLESRLPGEISITSDMQILPGEISVTLDMQMTPPLWQKEKN